VKNPQSQSEKSQRMHLFIALILLFLAFLHGAFASGFVPILNQALGPQAPWAFSLYFLGLLLGQLSIYLFERLNAKRWNYPLYEMGFGLSLIFMALCNNTPGFISGRLLEGLMGGLATPPLFNYLVTLNAFENVGKRVALFNSVFALGYVLGPVMVSGLQLLMPYTRALNFSGLLFILIPILLLLLPTPHPPLPDRDLSLKKLLRENDWFEKFSTLFLAKGLYGYLIAFTAGYLNKFLPGFSIAKVMLAFSVLFVMGQILTERGLRVFPKKHLEVYLPLLIAALLLAFLVTHQIGFIFVLALFHSGLVYIGTLNFGLKAATAREFALFSCLSDPAMIIGAGLASFGLAGVWGILLLLLLPALRALGLSPQRTRAEAVFPWIGPLTVVNVFRKQKDPLFSPASDAISLTDLKLESQASESEVHSLKLLFAGDLCPHRDLPQAWSSELIQEIAAHDLACLNLEGVLADQIGDQHLHAFTPQQLEKLLYHSQKPLFQIINLVNNHALDQGVSGFNLSADTLRQWPGLTPIDSRFQKVKLKNFTLGFLAFSFGMNFLLKRDPHLILLSPDKFLQDKKRQATWLEKIRELKAEVDLLILSWHWGYEAEIFPSQTQQACFHLLAEAGVDLLWGHHSHLVQPFEKHQNSICLYSCGNLSSNLPGAAYQQGALWSVELTLHPDSTQIQTVKPFFFVPENQVLKGLAPQATQLWHSFQEARHAST